MTDSLGVKKEFLVRGKEKNHDASLRDLKRDRDRYARRTELGALIGDAVMLGCIFAAGLVMLWVLT